jgi:hypothetical protein
MVPRRASFASNAHDIEIEAYIFDMLDLLDHSIIIDSPQNMADSNILIEKMSSFSAPLLGNIRLDFLP